MSINDNSDNNAITSLSLLCELMPYLMANYKVQDNQSDKMISANDKLVKDNILLDQVLLWPPNLFFFTSTVLSLTGSYYNALSPASNNENGSTHSFGWPLCESRYIQLLRFGEEEHNKYYQHNEMPYHTMFTVCYNCIDKEESGREFDKECVGNCKHASHTMPKVNKFNWAEQVQKIGMHWRYLLRKMNRQVFQDIGYYPLTYDNLNKHLRNFVPNEVIYIWYSLKLWVEQNTSITTIDKPLNVVTQSCKNVNKSCVGSFIAVPLESLLTLHAFADEACAGWGISKIDKIGKYSRAQRYAEKLLEDKGTLATIHASRGRILPKRHTPNVGITLRSFSSHLGFHRSSIDINWLVAKSNPISDNIDIDRTFSVLLFPWPLEVKANDFEVIKREKEHNLFTYNPRNFLSDIYKKNRTVADEYKEKQYNNQVECTNFGLAVEEVIKEALNEVKSVDMVIFPESSLSTIEVEVLTNILIKYDVSVYILGVREAHSEIIDQQVNTLGSNAVYFNTLKKSTKPSLVQLNSEKKRQYAYNKSDNKYKQYKHHRWKITRNQAIQYGLGRVLRPTVNWWEGINVHPRKVSFINLGRHITICPLICEDIARQDPIADLIRTVGPSMVVTILMDGPQKADRWSAKYASVLADDPGSSVITLTSYGMVQRWNQTSKEKSKVISLWNDGIGPAREIQLENNSKAVLLSLFVEERYEKVADSRREKYKTSIITLGGVHQIIPQAYK